jgi:N-acetylglucosamine-6-phosphate deacetylase
MSTLISGTLVDEHGSAAAGWVAVQADRIADVDHGRPPGTPDLAHDGLISPALCDLQVNGAGGVEALDGGDALDAMDALLTARGVTRWLAALPTADETRVAGALAAIGERAADPGHGLAGAHLEGPFLSREHAGVHDPSLLRVPDDGVPDHYFDPAVRLVTLAPELPGAVDLIVELRRQGIAVALGHSGASEQVAQRAVECGARLATHVFNAMAPLHHRAPGLVGVALTDPRMRPCVIADGHHIDPIVLRIVRAAAGGRVVLVSDASAAAAAPPRDYELAGRSVHRDEAGAVRTPDGVLAGSGILLDEAVVRWVRLAGASAAEALAAASSRPAAAIGLEPGLTSGARADFVLAGRDGAPVGVVRAGRLSWTR